MMETANARERSHGRIAGGLTLNQPVVGSFFAEPVVRPVGMAIANIIPNQPAQVLFAGLTPGFSGLYQINVVVPAGVSAGSSVPVLVTAAGVSSTAVTIAIQ